MDKKKFIYYVIVFVVVLLFTFVGRPFLPDLKEKLNTTDSKTPIDMKVLVEENEIGGYEDTKIRYVKIDITVEEMCQGYFSGEVLDKCLGEENCVNICKNDGCKYFNLEFHISQFTADNKCYCTCIERNKIKKALNLDEE